MAYRRACASLASLLLLSACFGDPSAEPDPPDRSPSATSIPSGPAPGIKVQRLLASNPSTLPFLDVDLPRRIARPDARLPSLLDDLPGRALMTYHPPEGTTDPEGWASEEVLFFGTDRHWRRLRMSELGLPDSTWQGQDTYGAGRLSPDGRWWATRSGAGPIVFNLATGRTRVIELPGNHRRPFQWLPDSGSFITTPFTESRKPRTFQVSVPDGAVAEVPYQQFDVGFAPDGTPLTLERSSHDTAVMVKWIGTRKVELGQVEPRLLRDGSQAGAVHTTERFALFQAKRRNSSAYDLVVVNSSTGKVEARLHYPVDEHEGVTPLPGWVDPETLLVETTGRLLAWRPGKERMYRVTDLPLAEPDTYWTVSVALNVRP